jgi:hypothetical protein
VVSPILHLRGPAGQRPAWTSIGLVVAVLRRHGGAGSFLTAGHVHVGLGDFGRDPGRLAHLLGLVDASQDALFRLAPAPGARYHHSVAQARPLPEPARGYQAQVEEQLSGNARHYGFSLDPLAARQRAGQAPDGDHGEFRLWDGDLDLGAIQARVRLSLALADAGSRGEQPPPRQPLGHHYQGQPADGGAAALDQLLRLFPGDAAAGREQVARLFWMNAWQPPLVPDIRAGGGSLLWASHPRFGPAWASYSQAAAGYPAPVIVLAPPGTESELASPPRGGESAGGYDPTAAEVSGKERSALRSQLQHLGPRAGARPVVIALHPAGTDEFARHGAWLVRPVQEDGRFRVTQEDSPAQRAGWRSERGWELISPDGARHDLQLTLLDHAAMQRALGIALALPNPHAGLLRIDAGWLIARSGSEPGALREAEALPPATGATVVALSLNPVSGRVQTAWDDLDAAAFNALLGIIGVPHDEQLDLVTPGARSSLLDSLARELSDMRGTRVSAGGTTQSRIQANDHLLANVNLLLRQWRDEQRTDQPSVGIEDVRRALADSPPIRADLRGAAHDVAEYLAFGAVTRGRDGGSGSKPSSPT